jgi:guanylate kinase
LVEQQSKGDNEITDFSQFPTIEDMYIHLEHNRGSKSELGVYCNKYVEIDPTKKLAIILTGFTCAGKDTVMDELEILGLAYHVVTATSRPRRKDEPEDKYHWIKVRKKGEKERDEEYLKRVKEEHGLIECDFHYNNIYGLPRQSLLLKGRGVPVIRPDINGTITLHEELPKFGFQPISVAVIPDSWEQIYRILLNEREEDLVDKKNRLMADMRSVLDYCQTVNFFMHNSRNRYGDLEGLERSVEGMRHILSMYT